MVVGSHILDVLQYLQAEVFRRENRYCRASAKDFLLEEFQAISVESPAKNDIFVE